MPTAYSERIFDRGVRPHFNSPELYKHHFIQIDEQIRELGAEPISNRLARITAMISNAAELYNEIENDGIMFFDSNCRGEHLPFWNRVIRGFPM